MKSRKLLKAMKKSGVMCLISIPVALGMLSFFGALYHINLIELVMTTSWGYAFWGGLPLSFILGVMLHYDEENKI